jgi:hypothetical protein
MPDINDYKCSKCGYALPSGWGYDFYVINSSNERIGCRHPGEYGAVVSVLGIDAPISFIIERTGFNSDCLCLNCLYQFCADLGETGWTPFWDIKGYKPRLYGRDKRQCPNCQSERVKTTRELIGTLCPNCREGIIEEIWTGRVS